MGYDRPLVSPPLPRRNIISPSVYGELASCFNSMRSPFISIDSLLYIGSHCLIILPFPQTKGLFALIQYKYRRDLLIRSLKFTFCFLSFFTFLVTVRTSDTSIWSLESITIFPIYTLFFKGDSGKFITTLFTSNATSSKSPEPSSCSTILLLAL